MGTGDHDPGLPVFHRFCRTTALARHLRHAGRRRLQEDDAEPLLLEALAALGARAEVTWAGPVAGGVPQIAQRLTEVAQAGATWVVCAWPESVDAVAEAAARVRGGVKGEG